MMKRLIFKRNSVTLIELIIIIAVGAVCVVPLLAMLSTAIRNTVNTESIAKNIYLAQEKMEELLTTDFYTLANDATLDGKSDVWTFGVEKYRWTIEAKFINPNAADLGATGAEITSPGRSNYLRIRVRVKRVQGSPPAEQDVTQEVTLTSLVTPR